MTTTPQGKPPARPATLAPEYTTGSELQTLREAAGLSRDALAELVGVQARTVKHWEHGRAGVPADVAAVVHNLAQWVRLAAFDLSRRILDSIDPARIDDPKAPGEYWLFFDLESPVVLLRYQHTADMLPSDRTRGARADCHGAAVAQVMQRLALDGVAARVVWFDVASFASWCQADHADDTPAARQAWAECAALPAQAVPARGDQPPASHTGAP